MRYITFKVKFDSVWFKAKALDELLDLHGVRTKRLGKNLKHVNIKATKMDLVRINSATFDEIVEFMS